ncbi:MAG: diguanylate cyclase [Pseudomonadota bacterium]
MKDVIRRPNPVVFEWLTLCVSLAVLGSIVFWMQMQEHDAQERRERERLMAQARVVNDNLGRQLEAISGALTNIVGELPNWKAQKDGMTLASQRLKAFTDIMPGVRTLAILDVRGTIVASNQDTIVGGNFRMRDYFQVPLRNPDANTLYVTPPFLSVLNTWVLNIVKVIPGPNGEFAGVVSASLDPREFGILLESVRYAKDMRVGLNHGDGKVFMTAPHRDDVIGIDLNLRGSFFSRHVESGRDENVFVGPMRSTGENRMAALRTIRPPELRMDKALMVAVSRDLDEIYARWRHETGIIAALFALTALSGVGGLVVLQRRQLRAEREAAATEAALHASRERFAIATDAARIGVWDYDLAAHRLIWDDWMHRIYGTTPAAFTGSFDDWRKCVHPDDLARATHEVENALRDGMLDTEFRVIRPDGETRHLKAHARVLFAPDGTPERMTGVNYDVTDEVRTAETLMRLNTQLKEQSELLRAQAFVDGLTGVANRRHFDEAIAAEWRRCRRDSSPLALLMIDIDHFKRFNDRYGHQAGDDCLKTVAAALKEKLGRSHDLVARYGGEEFTCLLPESDLAGALAKAEELRIAVESLGIPHEDSSVARIVTISIGASTLVPDGDGGPDQLVAAADAALYDAKHAGRNRVCAATKAAH